MALYVVYPSQHFPFGAAFVCQAGNFWTHPCILFEEFIELAIPIHEYKDNEICRIAKNYL